MKIVNPVTPTVTAPAAAAPQPFPGSRSDVPTITAEPWKNPAATAALRSSTQILAGIEDGIVRNYGDVDKVRAYAADLQVAADIFGSANEAISGDANKENDQFLPLIGRATGGVTSAQGRLVDKDLSLNWPTTRGDILTSIRTARLIATNVADQLDPNSRPPA